MLRVSFWNCSGFVRLGYREFCELTDIIPIAETWVLEESPRLPPFLSDYQPIWIEARKEVLGSRGRGSGSLLTLIKTGLGFEIVDNYDLW